MYEQCFTVPVNEPISASGPNMSVLNTVNKNYITVLHAHSVSLIDFDPSEPEKYSVAHLDDVSDSKSEDFIIQAKIFDFEPDTILIAVVTHRMIKIFQKDGFSKIYENNFSDRPKPPERSAIFGRPKGLSYFMATVFCVQPNNTLARLVLIRNGSKIKVKQGPCLTMTENTISDLDTNGNYIASGDVSGRAVVFRQNSENDLVFWTQFDELNPFAVSTVKLYNQILLVGRSSGHIRLYDLQKKITLAEVSAHSKWIPSMDVAESSGLVISCSEDTVIRLWELDNTINLHTSIRFPNLIGVGVVFMDEQGNYFAVSGYDNTKIFCYKKAD
ncbi:WD repeat-containing protein 54-like [Brevipalpus obovatus]|uniref:WD repeat-containing protein 54-like n=1 Tax=Brevipalpus obovatus TaxID=246614 RepID=UPI003D9F9854